LACTPCPQARLLRSSELAAGSATADKAGERTAAK